MKFTWIFRPWLEKWTKPFQAQIDEIHLDFQALMGKINNAISGPNQWNSSGLSGPDGKTPNVNSGHGSQVVWTQGKWAPSTPAPQHILQGPQFPGPKHSQACRNINKDGGARWNCAWAPVHRHPLRKEKQSSNRCVCALKDQLKKSTTMSWMNHSTFICPISVLQPKFIHLTALTSTNFGHNFVQNKGATSTRTHREGSHNSWEHEHFLTLSVTLH